MKSHKENPFPTWPEFRKLLNLSYLKLYFILLFFGVLHAAFYHSITLRLVGSFSSIDFNKMVFLYQLLDGITLYFIIMIWFVRRWFRRIEQDENLLIIDMNYKLVLKYIFLLVLVGSIMFGLGFNIWSEIYVFSKTGGFMNQYVWKPETTILIHILDSVETWINAITHHFSFMLILLLVFLKKPSMLIVYIAGYSIGIIDYFWNVVWAPELFSGERLNMSFIRTDIVLFLKTSIRGFLLNQLDLIIFLSLLYWKRDYFASRIIPAFMPNHPSLKD